MKRAGDDPSLIPQPVAVDASIGDQSRTSPMTDAIRVDLARQMTDLTVSDSIYHSTRRVQPNSPKLSCVETSTGVRKSVSHTPTPPPNHNGSASAVVHSSTTTSSSTTSTITSSSSSSSSSGERIAILDCGAQYGKVIDRRVREMNVEAVMLPLNTPASELRDYKAIIISGGPTSVHSADAPSFDPQIFHAGIPILGICYGFQLINHVFEGEVTMNSVRADGQTEVVVETECALFDGIPSNTTVLLTHADVVTKAAPSFRVVARTEHIIAGIANEELKIYGVQFHPEVDLSTDGRLMLHNFLYNIARCTGGYTMASREEECIREIRQMVGPSKKVIVMVSGGVDSAVCAALVHKALHTDNARISSNGHDGAKGEQEAGTSSSSRVIAVHVDNGFMRHNETANVTRVLQDIGLKPIVYNGTNVFRSASTDCHGVTTTTLQSASDPEFKRKIIGDTFMRVNSEVMDTLGLLPEDCLLAQGTLRPDLIESASALTSAHADTIKTHHNDTALVRELRAMGRVIEPLRDFHKDEVRQMGRDLGLPEHIVGRHPFPGPGLAIRVLCADTPFVCGDYRAIKQQLQMLVHFDEYMNLDQRPPPAAIAHIMSEEEMYMLADKCHLIRDIHLLPVRSVGVQGDGRSYAYVVAVQPIATEAIDWTLMFKLAVIIPRLCVRVNRVTVMLPPTDDDEDLLPSDYRITELSHVPTHLTPTVIDQIRLADDCATQLLLKLDDRHVIAQMPVILVPIDFEAFNPASFNGYPRSAQRTVCLRPFITNDFMTGRPAKPDVDLPEKVFMRMAEAIYASVPGISMVIYDVTSKPPGTTEWE